MLRYTFGGGTAVLTGAASGIGEALAHGLAQRGSNLVLLDRDADRLDAVAKTIQGRHPELTIACYVVDLADRPAALAVAETVLAEHPGFTLLINNAGVALRGRFDQLTLDEFEWVIDINFRAVALLSHALLPALKARPGAHLVNMSSVFGIIAPAGQSAYAASKFAVRGLTEALRQELADDGIGVTVVHPGGIRTRIATSARNGSGVPRSEIEASEREWQRMLTIDPAVAAETILDGVERRQKRVLIGLSAKIPDMLARLLPASYDTVLTAVVKLAARRHSAGHRGSR
jgi:short-subunit dehydrogenase